MRDRNEWFKDVKRLMRSLEVETVENPFAWPTVTSVTDGEDVLYALGLHPSRDVGGIVNVDIDEVHELVRLIEPEPVTGSTSDGYHTFDELYHHRAVLFSVIVAMFRGRSWKPVLTGAAAHCARRGRFTASAAAFTPCSRVMANELLLLRRFTHCISSFCAWPRRPKLVCGSHDLDAPIRRRAGRQGRAGYQRGARRLSQRFVRRDRRRRRDGDRLHRGHQVLPVLRRGALGEREL